MHPGACGGSADPLTGAIGQGRSAIQAHRPLEKAPGPTGAHAVHEGAILLGSFCLQHTGDHLHAGIAQPLQTTTGNTGIGIGECHHHPSDPCLDQGVRAGRGAAVMAARLQGDDDRAAAGGITGLGQGPHFGMGFTRPGMKPLPHQRAGGIEHHRAHQGIRTRGTIGQGRQFQGPTHPGNPALISVSDRPHELRGSVCTSRHSPTT